MLCTGEVSMCYVQERSVCAREVSVCVCVCFVHNFVFCSKTMSNTTISTASNSCMCAIISCFMKEMDHKLLKSWHIMLVLMLVLILKHQWIQD